VNVTGGLDMTLLEVDEAANAISAEVDPEANIIFGAAFDPSLDGKIRVSVVATGMDGSSVAAQESRNFRSVTAAARRAPEPVPAELEPSPLLEPAMAFETAHEEEQPDIFTAAAAEIASEPHIVAPVARIVDPAVAEAEDEPLFAEPAYEPRKPRGGFLSIFGGRPRYESQSAPAPQPVPAPSRGGAQPAEAAAPVQVADENEDLEIPSFLRRLAN
jgi:cell division protein FtsZ